MLNDRTLRVLEYEKMKEQLQAHAGSTLAKERIEQLQPYRELAEAKEAQNFTAEAAKVIRLRGQAPLGGIRQIHAHVRRAQIGGMLNAGELTEVSDTLYAGRRIRSFILDMTEETVDLPLLEGLVRQIVALPEIEKQIRDCIDENGAVLDSASSALRGLRQQMRSLESSVRSKLEQYTRSPDQQKRLSDSIVTIRNDRYVLPVKQEYRSSFGGIVHDQSSTGATLFIEPQAVVSMNNELREARLKEQREIERILQELSSYIAEDGEEILVNMNTLTELDFTFAKAYYARDQKAVQPVLNNEGRFRFMEARHPLIDPEEMVPLDLELGEEFGTLVITGPNTGGKTVTLKTAGLLTLMAQSGLFVLAEEEAEAAVFSKVFADIGDEQSIEQSLSTFSSHMTNIVDIVKQVDNESFVLFDEIGAGTDPEEGSALAVSILDYVQDAGGRLIATTHYSELKGYAYNREGVMNASVEFDVETLRPTYRLLVGVPGRSNAFAISRQIGLPDSIISNAEKEMSTDTKQVETMIASLDEQRKETESAWQEADELRQEASRLWQELNTAWNEVLQKRDQIIANAEGKAKSEVDKAKAQAEEIIAELKEMQKEGAEIKEHRLIEARRQMEQAAPAMTKKQKQVKQKAQKERTFEVGDEVKVLRFGQRGHIVEKVNDKEFQVQLGIMKMTAKPEEMEKLKSEPVKEPKRQTATTSTAAPAKPELDLRGERYEDAVQRLEKYLDEVVLAGYREVHIIHGKGTGALRKGVKEYLKNHPSVKSTRDGGMNEGGIGNTVAELK